MGLALLQALRGERGEDVRPRLHQRLTNPQRSFIESDLTVTVWWGANGIGKSDTTAEAVTRAIEGSLPWQSGPGPRTVMVTGNTWDQISVVLEGVMSGRAAGWFRKGIRFQSGRMMGQRSAIFDIVAGPGAGGHLRAATFTAGSKNIAGPRVEAIFSDEPLPEPIYNELVPRLFGRNGRLYITYTPTLGTSADVDYLWRAVDDPSNPYVGEIQTPLTLDAVTPRGGLLEVPWATQDEIDRLSALLSPIERQMRLGLSRHPRMDRTYFGDVWGPEHISDERPPVGARLGIGIDHGSKPGAERVMLIAATGYGLACRVWVLGEWSGTSKAGAAEVARAIISMLEAAGCGDRALSGAAYYRSLLEDVDYWVGDRAHGGDRRGGAISNGALKEALARILDIDVGKRGWMQRLPVALQRMWPPRKYINSDYEGMATLRRMMMGEGGTGPRLLVAPHCTAIQDDIAKWQGSRSDPHKDGLDALRYIVCMLSDPPAAIAA